MHYRYAEGQRNLLTEAQIEQLQDVSTAPLSERERLAVQFCELLVSRPWSMTDAFCAELKGHFSDGEIAELAFHTMYMNVYHCFRAAIDLEPAKGDDENVIDQIPKALADPRLAGPQALAQIPTFTLERVAGVPAHMAQAYRDALSAVWKEPSLPLHLKEMLRLKTAELAQDAQASSLRFREAPLTPEQLAAIADPGRSKLAEREILALQFAELLVTQPVGITKAFFDEMLLHYTDTQLVALCFFTLAHNSGYRFESAMNAPPREGGVVYESLSVYGV